MLFILPLLLWVYMFSFCSGNLFRELPWGALDDVVMGGVSEGTFQVDPNGGENGTPTGIFKGLFLSHLQENLKAFPDNLFASIDVAITFFNQSKCSLQELFPLQTMEVFPVSGPR